MKDASELPKRKVKGKLYQAENRVGKGPAIIGKVGFRKLKVHYGRTDDMMCGDKAAEGHGGHIIQSLISYIRKY